MSGATLLVGQLVMAVPIAAAVSYAKGQVWTPPNTSVPAVKPVPGTHQTGAARQTSAGGEGKPYQAPAVSLPAAGTVNVRLSGATTSSDIATPRTATTPAGRRPSPGAVHAGTSPVYVAARGDGSPASVNVTFASRTTALQAGVAGLLMSVSRADGGSAAGPVAVELDPAALAGLYGGGFAQRMALFEVPECALTTPRAAACQKRASVPLTQDPATGRIVADVTLPATGSTTSRAATTSAASSNGVALIATSVPAGSAGTYSATSIKPSDQWSAGGSTGDFSYTYPIDLPPSLGGSAPNVSLAYSSSSLDGETVATNEQASWIGDGWSYNPGFIERSYEPCSQDGVSGSADTCWAYGGHEITASGSGIAGAVVWDDASKSWKMGGTDATVQLLSGASNGSYDGEYWLITDTDGTRYYYGAGKLPSAEGGTGSDSPTASAWTEPVFCPNSGDGPADDSCYSASADQSSYAANMAYRWNLDFVVDPHGNVIEYTYGTETNNYARQANQSKLTSYIRGGYLSQISYGWRAADIAAEGAAPAPAAEVKFTVSERCTVSTTTCQYSNLSSSTASNWPDTPYDLNCDSGVTNCAVASESYWSTKRLTQIETYVNEGTTSATSYKGVDTYTLSQSFNDPGDGTAPALRLDWIGHSGVDSSTGVTGGTAPLPNVTFDYTALNNRVPGSTMYPAYNRFRISAITTETGGVINIAYTTTPNSSIRACDQTAGASVLPTPSNDTMLCYQEYWTPPLAKGPVADWFEKYVVSSVVQTDPTGGSPGQTATYGYVGLPAWHRNDSPFIQNAQRSWDEFRGFQQVITETGTAPDPVTETESTFLRGMNGDYTSQTGGTQRSVTEQTTFGDTVTDSNQFAGQTLETQTYAAAGGAVQAESEFLPWSTQVASHAETVTGVPAETAYYIGTATTEARNLLANGSWRTTKTVNVYNSGTGQLTQVDDQGDISLVGTAQSQETCTTTAFASPPAANSMMQTLPARITKVFVTAGGPVGTAACPALTESNAVSDSISYYDNQSSPGVIGSVGNVTKVQDLDHWTSGAEAYRTEQSNNSYDAYGRLTSTTNALGLVTNDVATPASGTLPTSTATTDATKGWTTTTTVEQARQLPLKVVDQNGNSTSEKYDALGRLKSVWLPGRAPTLSPSRSYTYSVNGKSAPTWVASLTLRDDNTYGSDYQIYDGFMQIRQDQTNALDGSGGALITDTFYNTDGWPTRSSSPYYITAAPTNALYHAADSDVPAHTVKTYDGRGRTIDSAFYSYANEQWDAKTSYPGADRTDAVPPSGGTPSSTFTDALGNTLATWRFTGGAVNDGESYAPGGPVPSDVNQISYTRKYVADGAQTTTTDTTGHVWTKTYNYAAKLVAATDPDTGASSSTYNAAGEVLTTTTTNSGTGTRTLAFKYDVLGRKTEEHSGSLTGPLLASWTYDTATGGKGYSATATSYDGSGNAYTQNVTGYNGQYQPTGETITIPSGIAADESKLAGTYSWSHTYTPNLMLPATTTYGADGSVLPAETVTTTRTVAGIAANIAGANDYLTAVTVDPWGRPTRSTMGDMPNQLVASTKYDTATGRAVEQFTDLEGASTHTDDISATWNPAGQVTSITDTQGGGTATDRQCFAYDSQGRLASAWTDTAGTSTAAAPSVPTIGGCNTTTPTAATLGGPAPYWQSYTYNADGDRASETDHDVTGNTANDLTHTYAYPTASGTGGDPNQLQSVTNASKAAGTSTDQYTYFPDGSVNTRVLANGTNEAFTYDAVGRTASVADSKSGNSASYVYGADGGLLLERDTTGGATTATLYLPNEQLTVNTATQAESGLRYYDTGAVTEIRSSSGTLTYETSTSQGTGTTMIDASTLSVTRRYVTPYGSARGTAPASWVDNRGFLGQPADPGVGLDVLGARLYDPTTGRFQQRDPVFEAADPQQIGGYGYGGNDPVNHSDPTGLDSSFCVTAACVAETSGEGYQDPGACATAECAYELGDTGAAGAVDMGCVVTCPNYHGSTTVTFGKGGNSASVTTTKICNYDNGDFGCKPGTTNVSRSAPKFIYYNGDNKCTTATCQQIALGNFDYYAAQAANCGGNTDCVNLLMGEATQVPQVDLKTANDYTSLGLQAPACHGFWGCLGHVVHKALDAASAISPFLTALAVATSFIPGIDVITSGLAIASMAVGALATVDSAWNVESDIAPDGHFDPGAFTSGKTWLDLASVAGGVAGIRASAAARSAASASSDAKYSLNAVTAALHETRQTMPEWATQLEWCGAVPRAEATATAAEAASKSADTTDRLLGVAGSGVSVSDNAVGGSWNPWTEMYRAFDPAQ